MRIVESLTHRMSWDTILLGVLDGVQLREIMATQCRLSVDHQRRIVAND